MSAVGSQTANHPESVRAMALALDWAWEMLPASIERNDATRRHMAMVILDRFLNGEQDPEKLSDLALVEIGLTKRGSIGSDELDGLS